MTKRKVKTLLVSDLEALPTARVSPEGAISFEGAILLEDADDGDGATPPATAMMADGRTYEVLPADEIRVWRPGNPWNLRLAWATWGRPGGVIRPVLLLRVEDVLAIVTHDSEGRPSQIATVRQR